MYGYEAQTESDRVNDQLLDVSILGTGVFCWTFSLLLEHYGKSVTMAIINMAVVV